MRLEKFMQIIHDIVNNAYTNSELYLGLPEYIYEEDDVALTDAEGELLIRALRDNNTITSIDLSSNVFTDKTILELTHLEHLKVLNLIENAITKLSVHALFYMPNLQELYLTCVPLSDINAYDVRPLLFNASKLQLLDVQYTGINTKILQEIIRHNNTLHTLYISDLDSETLIALPLNNCIKQLHISRTDFVASLASAVKKNQSLEQLTLHDSKMHMQSVLELNKSHLKTLNLLETQMTKDALYAFKHIPTIHATTWADHNSLTPDEILQWKNDYQQHLIGNIDYA